MKVKGKTFAFINTIARRAAMEVRRRLTEPEPEAENELRQDSI